MNVSTVDRKSYNHRRRRVRAPLAVANVADQYSGL